MCFEVTEVWGGGKKKTKPNQPGHHLAAPSSSLRNPSPSLGVGYSPPERARPNRTPSALPFLTVSKQTNRQTNPHPTPPRRDRRTPGPAGQGEPGSGEVPAAPSPLPDPGRRLTRPRGLRVPAPPRPPLRSAPPRPAEGTAPRGWEAAGEGKGREGGGGGLPAERRAARPINTATNRDYKYKYGEVT